MPTLRFDVINQHYEIHGSGEPFILHHGLSSSCQAWYPHLPWLAKKYQMILIDARGHGLTTAPAGDDRYSWEIMCDDVNRLMEYLEIERAIVGGLSMGGGVSLTFALKYPQKVKTLILSDTAGTGIRSPEISQEEIERQMESREEIVRNYGVVEYGYRTITAGLAPKPVLEDSRLQEEYLERMARFSVNGSIYASRFVFRTVVPGIELAGDLTMPSLVIIGEEDIGCLPGAEWLRDNLPNCRYSFLSNIGHGTSRYKPEAWRKAVENFLDDLGKGRDIKGEVRL